MDHQHWAVLVVLIAGALAGGVNVVVGSGTLITFPVLLFVGLGPVEANVTNAVGLVAGGISGVLGYRAELREHAADWRALGPASALGAVTGSLLLIRLSPDTFEAIVPFLIALGALLVLVDHPKRRERATIDRRPQKRLPIVTGALGIYGGYFGAAQGVLLLGVFRSMTDLPLQASIGTKNMLTTIVNLVAAVIFVIVTPGSVEWSAAGLIAIGSLGGGFIGARLARRASEGAIKTLVVVVAVVAIVKLVSR